MSYSTLNIKIIDTQTNSLVEVAEMAAYDSLQLKYNGAQDLYQAIMSSQLSFTFAVTDGSAGKFTHLFTGDELRYKVQLEDLTIPASPVLLWQGFLLTEQYAEPFTTETFFVDFIATDALGLLRNRYLPDAFYTDIKTTPAILAECLKATGNTFSIYIAPSIENAVATLNYSDLSLNTLSYIDKDKKQTAYQILEKILISIGCKLLQWQASWYVVGLNQIHKLNLPLQNYDSNGTYVTTTTWLRKSLAGLFEATPTLTKTPPFKTVEIVFKNNYPDSIYPDNLYYQPPANADYKIDNLPVLNWTKVTDVVFNVFLSSATHLILFDYTTIATYDPVSYYYGPQIVPRPNPKITGDPFYVSLSNYITSADVSANYIHLSAPIYLAGNSVLKNSISFKLTLRAFATVFTTKATMQTAIDNGDFDGVLLYEVLQGTTTLVSNKTTFLNYALFDFELKAVEQKGIVWVEAALDVAMVPINNSDYLDIKIHPPVGSAATTYIDKVVIANLESKYTALTEVSVIKNRAINYTTEKTIDVFHTDDPVDLTIKQILIASAYTWAGLTINTPAVDTLLGTSNFRVVPFYGSDTYMFDLTQAAFDLINANPDRLYVKRNSDGSFVKLNTYFLSLDTASPLDIQIFNTLINALDTLYIRVAANSSTITDKRYLRDKWQRVDQTEEITYQEALARVYHDVSSAALIKLAGTFFGIVSPLDLLEVYYAQPLNCAVVDLEIDLKAGSTNLTVIESNVTNVTNYE